MQQNMLSSLLQKLQKGEPEVVMLSMLTCCCISLDGAAGFQHNSLKSCADSSGVKIKITIANTISHAIELLKQGIGNTTSAAIALTDKFSKKLIFRPKHF